MASTPNLAVLTKSVSLVSVRTVRSSTRLIGIRSEDRGGELKLNLATKVGGAKSPDLKPGVRAVVVLECRLTSTTDPGREIASVECEMVLDYAVKDPGIVDVLSEDDLGAFAQTSGVYNAWPYLREFCQSASARMGTPILMVLPTLPPRESQPSKKAD